MGNDVVHFELGGPDGAALQTFYSELLGWAMQPIEGGYALVDTQAGRGVGGGIGTTKDGATSVVVYVAVPDLQQTLDKAESLGGKTVTPVTEIPDVVTFASFRDPEGNEFGIVQAHEHAPGEEHAQGPSKGDGRPVDWFEILGADGPKLRDFYGQLFGWTFKVSEGDGWDYGEVKIGDNQKIGGGIGTSPEGPAVVIYAAVDDLAKTLERAESLGATTAMPPMKVNDGLEIAQLTDPAGNRFGLYRYE